MNWTDVENLVRLKIRPGKTKILKSAGNDRRLVTAHKGSQITMRTGQKTAAEKSVTYEMIRFAFETLIEKQRFDSIDYRSKYQAEYNNGSCKYSMTGGVLVEVGVAERRPLSAKTCYYTLKEK